MISEWTYTPVALELTKQDCNWPTQLLMLGMVLVALLLLYETVKRVLY